MDDRFAEARAVTDDLSAPLGQDKGNNSAPSPWKRIKALLPLAALRASGGMLACCTGVFLGWALFAEGPLGGEPLAVAKVNLHPDAQTAAQTESPKAGEAPARPGAGGNPEGDHPNRYDGPAPAASEPPAAPGSKQTVTIIDGTNGKRQDFVVPGRDDNASAATDPRFSEATRSGPIPRVAPDGTRPAEAFAQPVKIMPDRPNALRIAIIVAGLGISATGTSDALAKLPGPVTFAFAPYGADLEHIAARAREGGHELLLQVPMEPFDYPDNDPGPQTLLTSLSVAQNVDRLHWLMSRLQGYVGIANYMGGRFTASDQALAPVLREAAKRGLIYVEDGNSPRSVAGQIAGANNLPYAKADVTLDAVPTGGEIDRALARLEKTARDRGSAVGMANALPASIERISAWAKTAESRGILLVPITAVAVRGKST